MPTLNKKLRRFIVRGPLHRPLLECSAQAQKICYTRTCARSHPPKVFCIGNFKTGTMSLDGLLGQQLTGAHEPHAYLFTKMWLKYKNGQLSNQEWQDFLIRRCNALSLDYEASGFLTTEAALLAELFPNSKFILTIREPESWLRSMLRHVEKNRQRLGYHYWEPVLQHYFAGHDFPVEETSLEARKLFPLRSMLNYWKHSNESAIRSIPADQLLILDTQKLSESLGQLESFMGWESSTLNPQKSHLHQSPTIQDPTDKISQSYLSTITANYQQAFELWFKD